MKGSGRRGSESEGSGGHRRKEGFAWDLGTNIKDKISHISLHIARAILCLHFQCHSPHVSSKDKCPSGSLCVLNACDKGFRTATEI